MKARFQRFAPEARPGANLRPSYLSRRYVAEARAEARAEMIGRAAIIGAGIMSGAFLAAILAANFILAHGGAPALSAILRAMGVE